MPGIQEAIGGMWYGWDAEEDGIKNQLDQNWTRISSLFQIPVITKELTAPPGSPVTTGFYIPKAPATGAWTGYENYLAVYRPDATAWEFFLPKNGWIAGVIDESLIYKFTESGWVPVDSLPPLRYPKNVFLKGIAESTSVSGYEYDQLNANDFDVLSNTTAGGGWLASLSSPPWIDLVLPFGVVIGDSIAEGHPGLHGRLHPSGSPGYDDDYVSQPGQINYRLSQLTNTHWYNHGLGSETTTQLLARFDRDACGLISDPGDGRGDKTLEGAPYAVLVCTAHNDISAGVSTATIINNLKAMCFKLVAANIIPIFTTVGQSSAFDAIQNANLEIVNDAIKALLPKHGAHVVDFYEWGSDGAGGVKSDLFVDDIHPNKAGYTAFSDYIINAVDADLVLHTFRMGSILDPNSTPTSWAKPIVLQLTRGSDTNRVLMEGNELDIQAGAFSAVLTPVIRLTIQTPTSGNGGFSRAVANFGRKVDAKSQTLGLRAAFVIQCVSGTWQISSSFINRGAVSISQDATQVTITTKACSFFFASLVGSATVTTNIRVTAAWTSSSVTTVNIKFGDGTSALNPNTIANNIFVSVLGIE